MDKPENPPAFPQLSVDSVQSDGYGDIIESFTASERGMGLRDYFSAHAPITLEDVRADARNQNVTLTTRECMEWLARLRIIYADAMLKARQS